MAGGFFGLVPINPRILNSEVSRVEDTISSCTLEKVLAQECIKLFILQLETWNKFCCNTL
jgi:hypothetical protein